jgi:hypothetical protein
VSEYNVPAPNDYASEALPMYASIAAAQDWDAIYAYTYLDFSAEWNADHLLGFFDLAGNPSALSFLPVAALTFRLNLLGARATSETIPLPTPSTDGPPLTSEGALARLWSNKPRPDHLDTTPRIAESVMSLIDKTTLETRGWKNTGWPAAGISRREFICNQADDCSIHDVELPRPAHWGRILWQPTTASPSFQVVAPGLRITAGKIAGTDSWLEGVRFAVGEMPRGDASIALVALDGLPLSTSKQMLLVSVARVENTGMRWNDSRTGLTSWGHGPALAEYVPLTVTLPGPELRAERLDPTGAIAAEVPVEKAGDHAVLRLDHQPSLWFLLRR